jgi:hypothetical protein
MSEPINVKCPSCDDEEHALEMPPERVRENVAAQLRDFDGYNARPISGT